MVFLRSSKIDDLIEVKAAYENSVVIHEPWVFAPENYENYLTQEGRYFVCLNGSGEIIGTFNISGIVRGYFQSAYLSYEIFYPYHGKGHMGKGLELLIEEAFNNLNLHRLEANIQPGNFASIYLVSKSGFIKEGFSKNYLRIGGLEWKDHERWALINQNWSANKTL